VSIELCSDIKEWLASGGSFPKTLSLKGKNNNLFEYNLLDRTDDGSVTGLAGRVGFKGFTLKVEDQLTGRILAAKLCLLDDYSNHYSLSDELRYSGMLSKHNSFVVYEQIGVVSRFEGQPAKTPEKWMCFISEWIEGDTLRKIIDSEPTTLRPSLIVSVVRQLIEAVLFLKEQNLKHDDLHMKNIMLESADQLQQKINPALPNRNLRIIDLGSIKTNDQTTTKTHDDWTWVIECIIHLHNLLHNDRKLASRHPRFLQGLHELAELLCDPDHSRFPELSDYSKSIDRLESFIDNPVDVAGEQELFTNPFEALSAEHLASDDILRRLFEDTLPWISVAKTNKPVVLTGPRGCGKSMVFKYMAAKTHSATEDSAASALKNFDFYGIYISCSSEIENDLLWMRNKEGIAHRKSDQLITFFNLILTRELCRSLSQMSRVSTARRILSLSDSAIHEISEFILSEMGEDSIKILARENRLSALSDVLDRYRSIVSKSMLSGSDPNFSLPLTFIRDLIRFLRRKIPFFETKPVCFLLDDYTSHRIGREVQQVLNPLIWQRHSEFNFKVSCEPKGFEVEDSNSKGSGNIQNLREFEIIDTSSELTSGSSSDTAKRKKFVEGLLDKRLAAADYKGRTSTLIGKSEHENDLELAKSIRNRGHKSGAANFYHGIETLANCWSGDVITTLFIVERMFKAGGVTKNTDTVIKKNIQHDAIRKVSIALVDRINHHYPLGKEMRTFIDGWGDMARHMLVEAALMKNGEPYRQYRVEIPLEGSTNIYQALDKADATGASRKILEQLVRRSVIVELPEGSPKEKWANRMAKFLFRSSLLPKYQTSFIRKDYVVIRNAEEFSSFLKGESGILERLKRRGKDKDVLDSITGESQQGDMFDG